MSAAGGSISAGLAGWVTTTDHKRIGILYLVTAFGFMLLAGLLAEVIRAELAEPGLQFVDESTYSQLFTIHGTLMMLFFAGPVGIGFANYLLPLQIGAADMAFPRLNALSYWMFLFGGLVLISGFGTTSGAASAGWTGYAPLTEADFAAGPGTDLWIVGLGLVGISGILGSVNFMTTVFARRAPGMTMFRLPLFTWAIVVTSVLILFSFPVITAALAMLFIDRHLGGAFFDPSRGGNPILWQHLFWFFGHPEVYIVVLPAFGIVSEVVPVFSRKPLFGYRSMILALVAIAALSMGVWAHHMFTTGAINLAFFSFVSFLIAVPTGIKIFNWIATMWRGAIRLSVPLLWCVGLIYVFTVGGISGVMVASPPIDFQAQDTYFVVAHLHNVLIGGTVFAAFAGIYFWFPKMTGRFLDERLGRLHWLSWIVGFAVTFIPQYQLGLLGMPRRIADYSADPQWATLNLISTIGAVILGVGTLPFLAAIGLAFRRPATSPADPWEANSLEWATPSPPPPHNFDRLPPIRSERPVFDARNAADPAAGGSRSGPATAPSPAAGAGP